MTTAPLPNPAERFALIVRGLTAAVVTRGLVQWLAMTMVSLIVDRLREINQRVARLAARIGTGRCAPRRRPAPPRPPAVRRPRQPGKLPHHAGWLLQLVPDAIGFRSQLEYLLRQEDTAAFLAAAPASLARPLRSLCWMLGLSPPGSLVPPARPPSPRQRPAAPPQPPPEPPPEMPPEPGHTPPRRPRRARILGPPAPYSA